MTAQLELTYGRVALIDEADLKLVSLSKWFVSKCGYVVSAKRLLLNGKMTQVYLHRYLLGPACLGLTVDNVNGDKLDNRRCNLRPATHRENSRNQRVRFRFKGIQRSSFTSRGISGVKLTQCPSYSAKIKVDYVDVYLGSYATEEAAAYAYNSAAVQHFGAFAKLNEVNHGILDGIGDSLFLR